MLLVLSHMMFVLFAFDVVVLGCRCCWCFCCVIVGVCASCDGCVVCFRWCGCDAVDSFVGRVVVLVVRGRCLRSVFAVVGLLWVLWIDVVYVC